MTNWKKLSKAGCKYFGEQDFETATEIKTVTIAKHSVEEVMSEKGKNLKGVLYFRESNVKPLILNVTNGRTIALLYGKDADMWIGKKISLYFDPKVRFGREAVGGTRVKAPPLGNTDKLKCFDCGTEIQGFEGKPPEYLAAYTTKKYGKQLCASCAEKKANEGRGEDVL